ncbi:NAD(P)-dependent oxidoreductase [Paracoccaceae bacterium]|nr:NAD(P)-dependent oxidoreductase [Paracoccaceae bacterium]
MILVTGGTGYIGSQVCKILEHRGLQYKVLSRENGPSRIKCDLLTVSDEELTEILRPHTKIIHCAWYVEPEHYLKSTKNFDWIRATLRLANAIGTESVEHFLSLGTCLEYQSSEYPKDITHPLGSTSNYSLSKFLTLQGLSNILSTKRIPFAWCRVFHLHGGNEDPLRLMPSIRDALNSSRQIQIKNSSQLIDLSNVRTVANDIVKISHGLTGEFNLCSGNGATIEHHVRYTFKTYDLDRLIEFQKCNFSINNLSGIRNVPN